MSDGEAGSSAPGVFSARARGGCRESVSRSARWGEDSADEVGGLDARDDAQHPTTQGQCLMSMWTARLSRCIQLMGGVGGHRHRGRALRGLRVGFSFVKPGFFPASTTPWIVVDY